MEGLENIKFLFAPSHKFVKSNNGVLILQGIWRFDFSNKNIEGDLEWYVCSNKFKDGCDATATVAVAREETEFEEVKHLVNWPEKPFEAHSDACISNHPHQEESETNQENEPIFAMKKTGTKNENMEISELNCNTCAYAAKEKWQLKRHIDSKHVGIKYSCDKCDFQAESNSSVKRHVETKHNQRKYSCDRCAFVGATKGNLKQHVEHKHGVIRYSCGQCAYVVKSKYGLKQHQQNKHKDQNSKCRSFKCDVCDYTATRRRQLEMHQESIHKGIR